MRSPLLTWTASAARLALLLPFAGCASTQGEAAPQVAPAEQLYQEGLEDLEDGLYPEALEAFAQLKTKFPYSKFAALADLRTGDTHYERGKFLESIDSYRNFLKYHPTHEMAPYAMSRIADSYHEQIPEDWLILPPSSEKDQASTRLAISAYRDLLARYPNSEQAVAAQERLTECRRKLADHEMYVANFYYKRARFLAAASRAEGLLRDYPGLGLDAEALWIAGASRFKAQELELARTHLERLLTEHADFEQAPDARLMLTTLGPRASGGAASGPAHELPREPSDDADQRAPEQSSPNAAFPKQEQG